MYDFLQEFAVRMAIAILVILFLLQLVKLAGKVLRSKAMQIILGVCAKVIQWLANLNPILAGVVRFIAWTGHMIATAFKGFHQIEEDDDDHEVGEKIRVNYLLGLIYDVGDYWLSAFCFAAVSQMMDWHWPFIWMLGVVWMIDITHTVISVVGCTTSGKDLTLGEAHRRAFNALWPKSRFAGIVYVVIQHPIAVIWDGPEQLLYFYQDELDSFVKFLGAGLYLTILQALFWAWAYSVGHTEVVELIQYVLR